MKKVMFLSVFLLVLFSCDGKKNNYSKELQKIFDTYGGIETWKNVKSVSFSIGKENFTADLASGKKVINAPSYSLGFDGENYWSSDKCTIQSPEKHIKKIANAFLIPFSLADTQQIGEDKNNKVLHFINEAKVFYNPNSFVIEVVEHSNNKTLYQEWQENVGFTLPKKVEINETLIEFTNVQLSQTVFDDRFYQKP